MPYYARPKVDYTPLPVRVAAEWLRLEKNDPLYEYMKAVAATLVTVAAARGLYSTARWILRIPYVISRYNI